MIKLKIPDTEKDNQDKNVTKINETEIIDPNIKNNNEKEN